MTAGGTSTEEHRGRGRRIRKLAHVCELRHVDALCTAEQGVEKGGRGDAETSLHSDEFVMVRKKLACRGRAHWAA